MTAPICIAPFRTAVIDRDGTMLPCCEYMADIEQDNLKVNQFDIWWESGLDDLRNKMLTGVIDRGCRHCHTKEKNPEHFGHRQFTNQQFQDQIDQVANESTHALKILEVRFSNYCNLKCLMCGSESSSSITNEYLRHQEKYNKLNVWMDPSPTVRWWENAESLRNFKNIVNDIEIITFTGGEPLIIPEVVELIDQLDCKKIKELQIITNLTRLSDKFLKSIKRFAKVVIRVSLEGINKHNDYIRYGSDWKDIEKNINVLNKLDNVVLSVNHTLQHTSLFTLPNLVEYTDQIKIHISLNEVYHESYPGPGVLSINSANSSDVDEFKDWLEEYQGPFKEKLSWWVDSYVYNDELNRQFRDYINMLDSIRNLNFLETFGHDKNI